MTKESYNPFYLDSVSEIADHYYILNGYPQDDYHEDYYHEIHLESLNRLNIIKDYANDYIYVDVISPTELEIYIGEFYEECCSDGRMSYTKYDYKKVEKTSRDWKVKVLESRIRLNLLLDDKVPEYKTAREKFVRQFKASCDQHIHSGSTFGLTGTELSETRLFERLYRHFENMYEQHYLEELASPNRKQILEKDWKDEHLALEERRDNLLNLDLDDAGRIKTHVIDIYKKAFEYFLSNLRYSHIDLDQQNYRRLFDSIIQGMLRSF